MRQVLICLLANAHALLEGVPGPGQDDARAHARGRHRLRLQPHPVHARPDARGHRGHERPRRGGRPAGVPVPVGAGLRQPAAGGRDQPRHAQDPVGAAGGDAGAPGLGRARAAPAGAAVLRAGDPEPARDGGHLSPARGAARPLPVQALGALPVGGGPGRDHGADHRARAMPTAVQGRRRAHDRGHAAAGPQRAHRAPRDRLRRVRAVRHAPGRAARAGAGAPLRALRRLAARRPGARAGGQDPRPDRGPLQRGRRGHPGRGACPRCATA